MSEYQLTDQRLSEIAEQFAAAMMASLPTPAECDHVFSPAFEKKMDKLLKKEKRQRKPMRIMRRVAAVFLAALLTASTWLAVDTEARAAFMQWVREVFEDHFVYHYYGECPDNTIGDYTFTWFPEDCEVSSYMENDTRKITLYQSASGDAFLFSYHYITEDKKLIIDTLGEECVVEQVTINGISGQFYDITSGEYADTLVWIDDEAGIAFMLESFCDKDIMLRMAESVRPGKVEADFKEYRLMWVPDGYALSTIQGGQQEGASVYRGNGNLDFEYRVTEETELSKIFEIEAAETTLVQVNDMEGAFYTEDDENVLCWLNQDTGVAFTLYAAEDLDTMLKIAGSVYWEN